MKEHFCMIMGLFGGWDASMVSLMIFMGVDYATGLIVAVIGSNL
ncbi:MAG: phage holin family protein [Oscillospiraceae bacterium]|nr:phage holin family protein [Oscillospiraceae bacterium]